MTPKYKARQDAYNHMRRAAEKRNRCSIPARIEAIGRREDNSHTGHQRRGIAYAATCATCQKKQLGVFGEGHLHAVRNPIHKQPRYHGCQ